MERIGKRVESTYDLAAVAVYFLSEDDVSVAIKDPPRGATGTPWREEDGRLDASKAVAAPEDAQRSLAVSVPRASPNSASASPSGADRFATALRGSPGAAASGGESRDARRTKGRGRQSTSFF